MKQGAKGKINLKFYRVRGASEIPSKKSKIYTTPYNKKSKTNRKDHKQQKKKKLPHKYYESVIHLSSGDIISRKSERKAFNKAVLWGSKIIWSMEGGTENMSCK
jgi:hypothetical protein